MNGDVVALVTAHGGSKGFRARNVRSEHRPAEFGPLEDDQDLANFAKSDNAL